MSQLSLSPLAGYKSFAGPLLTIVMDGVGLGPGDESDGVHMAYTPVLDGLLNEKLVTRLKAHGKAVGLPSDSDMGNSEVGHNALGAGRIFAQGAKLVNEALETGAIFAGHSWQEVKKRSDGGGTLHFIGMISDGNVHSHVDQLYRLLERCRDEGIQTVRIHGLLDGRDVAPKSAMDYFSPLEEKLKDLSREGRDYCMASGGGRMLVTMDRYEADWRIVEKGWQAHVLGVGRKFSSASEAIRTYYEEDPDLTDQ
ncbi:MAG: 2,3-bisphosphoglycerate-independent phosphoglycerate mutase, partial [Thermodesulfobacteriota bacterium]